MRHPTSVSTLLALLVTAAAAHAANDVVLRQRIIVSSTTEVPREQTQYYSGPLRITDDDRATTIVNLDKRTITLINKQDKTYSVTTFAELEKRGESHDQRVKQLPPQIRDTVNADVKVDLKPTGKTETIAGYETQQYSFDAKGIVGSVWVAEKLDLGARTADWAKVSTLFGGRNSPGGHLDEALSRMKGVPMRRIVTMEPLPLVTSEVVEVRHAPPPAALQHIPQGYKKVDFPAPRPKPAKATPAR
jgi:hypothetical protein